MILDTCALLWLAIHNDPCDRFIIAEAKRHDLTVVTADERFEKYGLTLLD